MDFLLGLGSFTLVPCVQFVSLFRVLFIFRGCKTNSQFVAIARVGESCADFWRQVGFDSDKSAGVADSKSEDLLLRDVLRGDGLALMAEGSGCHGETQQEPSPPKQ